MVEPQRIPFATESAALDSPSESIERLVNFYVEKAPEGSKSPLILKSNPLLSVAYTVGAGPIHAMNADLPGVVYVVSSDTLYKITNGSVVNMGVVGIINPTSGTFNLDIVTIAVGPSQMAVCVPPVVYAATTSENTIHPVNVTASSVAYIDGYFVYTAFGNSSQFFCSGLFNPSTVSALDFSFADTVPDVVRRVISHLDRLWFLGEASIQIQFDAGDVGFPFRRDAGGLIPFGVLSAKSATVCDGSIFWLGANGIVFRTQGYNASRVSTAAIERRIADYLVTGAVVKSALSYVYAGHTFYALTLQAPSTPGLTLEYDCLTQRWHDRSSTTTGTGRWVPDFAVLAGVNLFGSSVDGSVYTLNESGTTDGTTPVKSIAISPPIWGGTKRAFMSRVEVETEMGGSPLLLDWTNDNGATWSNQRSLLLTGKRAYTTRLGSFRERSLRITTSGKSRILGVDAVLQAGA